MKTINEIRDWLLENAVDNDGDLMLDGLDFSNFDGDVSIGHMKVKKNLYRGVCEVGGDLAQGGNNVEDALMQSWNKVKGDFYSNGNKVGGIVKQTEPTKLLKEISVEELTKMGYKLKEEN